jgi:hypothetical protein
MPMIVCMNINTAGERYIAYLKMSNEYTRTEVTAIARNYKEDYDEVYIIDIDPADDDFIDTIVRKGCHL